MSGHLTSDEWHRITEFAETPKHQRRPEQLLPESERTHELDEDEEESDQRE